MMSEKPLISVVIPIYNVEKYLDRCLSSVKTQTYENFEVLLVDDGSTDLSAEICRLYCEEDDRFRYFKQENLGPDIARKTGTREALGDYLVYVDSDDYIANNALNVMVSIALETDADIVCSQFVRFNENKIWQGSVFAKEIVYLKGKDEIYNAFFEFGTLLGTYVARLIKRDIIKDYKFIKDGLIGEDITAALHMFDNSEYVVIIPNITYYYYHNSSSISHSKYTYRHATSLNNYISLRDRYLDNDFISKERICGYFAGFQMAVATAMGRKGKYETDVGEKLRGDLKKHWSYIRQDKQTQPYMKMCIFLYMTFPRLFVGLYHVFYLLTGR